MTWQPCTDVESHQLDLSYQMNIAPRLLMWAPGMPRFHQVFWQPEVLRLFNRHGHRCRITDAGREISKDLMVQLGPPPQEIIAAWPQILTWGKQPSSQMGWTVKRVGDFVTFICGDVCLGMFDISVLWGHTWGDVWFCMMIIVEELFSTAGKQPSSLDIVICWCRPCKMVLVCWDMAWLHRNIDLWWFV